MSLTRQTMTDEQRKSVALEYLKAFLTPKERSSLATLAAAKKEPAATES